MKGAPWFAFYAKDFYVGTSTMNSEELAAYIRLLCLQWDSNGVPGDVERLHPLVYQSPEMFKKIWSTIGEKFEMCEDGKLRNPRLEEERDKFEARSEAGRVGAKARWEKERRRKKKHATAPRSDSDRNATAMRPHSDRNAEGYAIGDAISMRSGCKSEAQSEAQSESETHALPDAREEFGSATFDALWSVNPHKAGEVDASREWFSILRQLEHAHGEGHGDVVNGLRGIVNAFEDQIGVWKSEGKKWEFYLAEWLRKRRWKDDLSAVRASAKKWGGNGRKDPPPARPQPKASEEQLAMVAEIQRRRREAAKAAEASL